MKKIFFIFAVFLVTACVQQEVGPSTEIEDSKATLKRIAKKLKSSGDMQTALQLESQLISLDEKDVNSFIDLAKSLREINQNEEALSLLFKAEKINPTSDIIKIELAKSLVINDQPDAAIAKLGEVKELKNFDYYNLQGMAYDSIENYQLAQSSYKKGLRVFQKNGTLLNNLALSHLLNGEYKTAIVILEELNKRPELNEKYRHNLALAYGLNKQNKKAYNILLKEITPAQAKENLKYYKEFR